MRKFLMIFTTVVLSVVCLSVSVFASETCSGSVSVPIPNYETGMLMCDSCGQVVCMDCWNHEASCSCDEFDPYYCTYCGVAICECKPCGVCRGHADNNICRACGLHVYDCTCIPYSGECSHFLISDFYLNEDGVIESAICHVCGESAPDFVGVSFEEAVFAGDSSYWYSSGKCEIHRGSLTYSMCEHAANLIPETLFLYIDQYGMLNGVCSECNVMINVNYMEGDPRTITCLSESDLAVLVDYGDYVKLVNYRLDSYGGFLTFRCDCGWFDGDNPNYGIARVNGMHELYCLDCEGVYFGAFLFANGADSYECTGTDCAVCKDLNIDKDIVSPSATKTLTDYVTDTGSILSNGLDMASTIAKTVTENPVLLLLYAIPFTAIAAIVFRKVKR